MKSKFFKLAAACAAAFAFAGAGQVFAQSLEFSGSLSAQAGIGLPYTNDNKGKFLTGQTTFDGIMKFYLGETMTYINGQIVFDAVQTQSSNGMSLFAYDGFFSAALKEAYLDWSSGMFALRIGRQIAGWGKADDIQIADILCPKDETTVIGLDYKEQRLGIDAARFSFIADIAQIDAYWIPFFTPSLLPLAQKNPVRPQYFPDDLEGIPTVTPQTHNSLAIWNSEFALRSSFYFSKFDLSFYGFYGWDDLPFFSYSANFGSNGIDSVTIGGKYKRMAMVGADAAIPLGDFVFRLEAAYFPNRHIQTSPEWQLTRQQMGLAADSSKERHQLAALAGLDWSPQGGWTITAQYAGDAILNHDSALDRDLYIHQFTLSVEKTLLNELLTLTLQGAVDLTYFSSNFEIEADYKLSDAITLSAIIDLYLKGVDQQDGLFGESENLSCGTLKAKVSF